MPTVLRILIVDDDAVITELLAALLGPLGHLVDTASSGRAALALLEGQAFDVVLTDLRMAGVQGAELARRMRPLLAASTRLVGMSASAPSEVERAAFDAFIRKPFGAQEFVAALVGISAAGHNPDMAQGAPRVDPPGLAAACLDEVVFRALAGSMAHSRLREFCALAMEDAGQRIERMNRSYIAGNGEALRSEAHSLKGTCSMMGAAALAALAASTEVDTLQLSFDYGHFCSALADLRSMLIERSTTLD